MKPLGILGALFVLAGCQTAPLPVTPSHPFVGCWESDSGLSREVWNADPSGWLAGYAISRGEDGTVSFYEAMRIERGEGVDVFVATGADGSTTRFPREKTEDPSQYRFVNADHDFPQLIIYRPSPGRLDAEISFMDGSNRVEFLKAACESN